MYGGWGSEPRPGNGEYSTGTVLIHGKLRGMVPGAVVFENLLCRAPSLLSSTKSLGTKDFQIPLPFFAQTRNFIV